MDIKNFFQWLGLNLVRMVIFGTLIPMVCVGVLISLPGLIWGMYGE